MGVVSLAFGAEPNTSSQRAEAARPALEAYAGDRTREALAAARRAIAADEQNLDALMAAGLASFRLADVEAATGYFKLAAAADSSGVEAQNNLGAIAFLTGSQGEAIAHYTAALRLGARNRVVLDNITELVRQYQGKVSVKDAAAFQNLRDVYERAEAKLEAEMAKKGLKRFGSTWVDKAQLEALNKNLETLRKQQEQMDADYLLANDEEAEEPPPPPPPPQVFPGGTPRLLPPQQPKIATGVMMPGRMEIPMPKRAVIPKFKQPPPVTSWAPPKTPVPDRIVPGGGTPGYPVWNNDPPKEKPDDPYDGTQGDPQTGSAKARIAELKNRATDMKLLMMLAKNPAVGLQVLLEQGQGDSPPPVLPLAFLVELQQAAMPHKGVPGPISLEKLPGSARSVESDAPSSRVLGGVRAPAGAIEFFAHFGPAGTVDRREFTPLK
jgi:tetratricopeptide (TPR) repeat protein